MKFKILDKERIPRLIDGLIEEYAVYAPVKKGKIYRFAEISSGEEAYLELHNTKLPPKEVFFPQTEVLFTYEKGAEGEELVEAPAIKRERVLFGVRPCDAKALALFDRFFASGDYRDPLYLEKREKTAIVGLACNRPWGTCFCVSVGGSPHGREGMDLLLVDLGDKYLVEILTERGEKLVENVQRLEDASDADIENAERLSEEAESAIKTELSTEGISDRLDGMFDDPLWDGVHQKCVGCGACSYLCPTCWCFDVLDEEMATGAKRVRLWDTCQFPLFTLQGSGFNPRPSAKERMRQRVMHKFNYYPKEFGLLACVGCGRCVRECPVNLDIREIIRTIMSD